jgi:hypothetical protein
LGWRRRTSGYWAANKNGPEWGRLRERGVKGLNKINRAQAIEFKCEFEFKQPKLMHQHEYNKLIL